MVEVQSMMKRHQLLESDIANHDSIVKALTSKGEQVRLGIQSNVILALSYIINLAFEFNSDAL